MRRRLVFALICLAALGAVAKAAYTFNLKDLVGVVGGGIVVKTLAEPIDKFINEITLNRGVKSDQPTKVVPIVSLGSGLFVGAAQVSGPAKAVAATKAVARIETTFQGRIRVDILVPIDSENPLERFRRVQGVGVSAIIDVKI